MDYRETYGQYCPVAKAAEIFADRWTPLIVRELVCGSTRFNDLYRGLPGISRSLLVARLRRLERAGVVERQGLPVRHQEYALTPAGHELEEFIDVLGNWGARWAFADPQPDDMDPVLLLWWVRRRINRDLLPSRRIVVEFNFSAAHRSNAQFWLLMERGDVSICVAPPGFDTDLLIHADLAAFYRVWFGRMSLDDAISQNLVRLDGPSELVRAFPSWLKYSHFADAVRAGMALRASPKTQIPAAVGS